MFECGLVEPQARCGASSGGNPQFCKCLQFLARNRATAIQGHPSFRTGLQPPQRGSIRLGQVGLHRLHAVARSGIHDFDIDVNRGTVFKFMNRQFR